MPRRKFNLDYPRLGAFAWIRADRPGKAKRNKGRLRRQRCRVLSIKGFASPPKQQARCDATATRHCRNCRRRILRLRQNRLLLLARPRAPSAGDNDVRGVRHRSRHGADIDSIDIMYLPHNTNRTRRPSPSGYVSGVRQRNAHQRPPKAVRGGFNTTAPETLTNGVQREWRRRPDGAARSLWVHLNYDNSDDWVGSGGPR